MTNKNLILIDSIAHKIEKLRIEISQAEAASQIIALLRTLYREVEREEQQHDITPACTDNEEGS